MACRGPLPMASDPSALTVRLIALMIALNSIAAPRLTMGVRKMVRLPARRVGSLYQNPARYWRGRFS